MKKRQLYIFLLSVLFIFAIESDWKAFANENDVTIEENTPVITNEQAKSVTILQNAPLYDSEKLDYKIGVWQTATQPIIFEQIQDKFVQIQVGGVSYYIPSDYITYQLDEITTNQFGNPIGDIYTKKSYTVYSDISSPAAVYYTGTGETKFNVLAIENNYYVIEIGGQYGYILMDNANSAVLSQNAKVIVNGARIYQDKAGISTIVANFAQGTVFKPTYIDNLYVYIKTASDSYKIDKSQVLITNEATQIGTAVKAPYPTMIQAKKTATMYSQKGVAIGEIAKGENVKLLNIEGEYGVITYLGGTVRVDLAAFLHTNQIMPKKNISYNELVYQLQVFNKLYPEFTQLVTLGNTVEKRKIYAIRVGNGKKEILMDASMHAREHMTTNVLLEMIDQYAYHYVRNTKFSGYQVKSLLDSTSIWFVPMMNPDGVTLVQSGLNAIANKALVSKINGKGSLTRWKANIRGVDLNRNFEGGWADKVTTKAPFYKNYKGTRVFSEPESKSLRDFVKLHKFKSYISYHSSGNILYWFHFQGKTALKRDKALAQQIGRVTGYGLMAPLYQKGSGASTDWFIQNYKMPGITVEIAPFAGEGPVPLSRWNDVWNRNKTIGLLSVTEANKR